MHRAYCDESEPGGGLDHAAYILAAVIVDDSHAAALRDAIERLRPARMKKLHWYEAIEVQRHTWRGLLGLAVATIVVRYDGSPAVPSDAVDVVSSVWCTNSSRAPCTT